MKKISKKVIIILIIIIILVIGFLFKDKIMGIFGSETSKIKSEVNGVVSQDFSLNHSKQEINDMLEILEQDGLTIQTDLDGNCKVGSSEEYKKFLEEVAQDAKKSEQFRLKSPIKTPEVVNSGIFMVTK